MIINNMSSPAQAFPTSFPSVPVAGRSENIINARVVVRKIFDDDQGNTWPASFLSVPRRGDIVQSEDGRRLAVIDVVHTTDNGRPELIIEVGTESNAVTPTEGGGAPLTGGDPF